MFAERRDLRGALRVGVDLLGSEHGAEHLQRVGGVERLHPVQPAAEPRDRTGEALPAGQQQCVAGLQQGGQVPRLAGVDHVVDQQQPPAAAGTVAPAERGVQLPLDVLQRRRRPGGRAHLHPELAAGEVVRDELPRRAAPARSCQRRAGR